MTAHELIKYKMTQKESQIWDAYVEEILRECENVNLRAVFNTNIEDRLRNREPWGPILGYSEEDGYYQVWQGDGRTIHIMYQTKSKEEAMKAFFSNIAHDFSYRYVTDNKKEMDEIKKREWNYATEYDYRKYWFELALYFCGIVMDKMDFEKEVARYEGSLNHQHNPAIWVYDGEKKAFVFI